MSLSRVVLAPVVFWFLISERLGLASVLFLLASLSDWADGWLARAFSWQSRLGQLLDPIADKLLVFLTCLGLALADKLPWWLFCLIIGRDILILICGLLTLWRGWHVTLTPSWISKINTALQFSLILDCLINPFLPDYLTYLSFAQEMIYTVAITTVVSGIDYAYRFLRQLLCHPSRRSLT
ncbi:MAG: CDP-alcohol phosphatidyltransferase family protein [Alphaproteobacteria bacterium]